MFCRISLRTPCPNEGSGLRLVWRELGNGILRRKANGGNEQERPGVGEFGTGHGSSPPRWKAKCDCVDREVIRVQENWASAPKAISRGAHLKLKGVDKQARRYEK
jgi:hypothetical protein